MLHPHPLPIPCCVTPSPTPHPTLCYTLTHSPSYAVLHPHPLPILRCVTPSPTPHPTLCCTLTPSPSQAVLYLHPLPIPHCHIDQLESVCYQTIPFIIMPTKCVAGGSAVAVMSPLISQTEDQCSEIESTACSTM